MERSGEPTKHKSIQCSINTTFSLALRLKTFVAKVLTLADEAGGFGLILPSKMLDQVSYSSTREALISKGLNAALDLGNGFFPSITESAALLTGTPLSTDTDIQMGFSMPIVVQ